ncbi:competence type IV pilus major pilin ComGC [Trichococcus ilyis]|jgi:competence protein ComGC|uniref:Bacterial general secretion pathway protein g-type pilin n=1 Tax=Trichococcus ilyis TaxID=640938 RepID=A0A143YSY5_9LACT|nr:competence type IV pilus major pilin ComGC [Trichococcus ilyis]CZQ97800.1 bacterial general secretion pathway protein g-type pilin [Trichococcus ilyis]SEJ20020.1 competence protein ComGC [Trichococcus ilyis]
METIKKTLKNKEAFTLMEMVLVLFIISVLMLMIIPNVANTKESVEAKGTDALAVVVQTQADMYELDTGTEAASFTVLSDEGYISAKQLAEANAKLTISAGEVGTITPATTP